MSHNKYRQKLDADANTCQHKKIDTQHILEYVHIHFCSIKTIFFI